MKNILLSFVFLAFAPEASSQQRAIIFEYEAKGVNGIYIMDNGGGAPKFITKGSAPSPSPDGMSVAYVFPDSRGNTGNRSIRIRNIETGYDRELVGMNACFPRWSPSGNKVLFECYGEEFQIYISDTDGRNIKKLLNDAKNPAWSPDGKFFAFIRDFDLYTYEVETGIETRLIKSEGIEKFPSWSPGGKYIVYRYSSESNFIQLMELATNQTRNLAEVNFDHISWTPQGQLLYDKRDKKGNTIIMSLDPHTGANTIFNKSLDNGYWAEWIAR